MKKITLSLILILGAGSLSAQEATTEPVGFNKVVCLASSDTIVSVPFKDSTNSITGTIEGTIIETGTAPDNIATFTLEGVTGLTPALYDEAYYVHFLTGNLAGGIFQADTNTATTLSMHLHGEDVAQLTAGDTFKIYKFWTLGTLFPPSNTTIVDSTGDLIFQRMTEVILHNDRTILGINKAADKLYFRKAVGGWIDDQNKAGGDASDVILWPDSPLVIRHTASVPANTTLITKGIANIQPESIPLFTNVTGGNDNYIALPRPVPTSLVDLNLIANGAFTPSTGTLIFQRKDELLVFDNTLPGLNKAAAKVYFYFGGQWVDSADTGVSADNVILTPSQGIVIRKATSATGDTAFWTLPKF